MALEGRRPAGISGRTARRSLPTTCTRQESRQGSLGPVFCGRQAKQEKLARLASTTRRLAADACSF